MQTCLVRLGQPAARMTIILAAAILSQAFSEVAQACSFGVSPFKPTHQRFDWILGPGTTDAERWYNRERVPAPVVEVTGVRRATNSGNSCDYLGWITLSVSLPASSGYNLEQFGIFFRVVDGSFPDGGTFDRAQRPPVADGRISLLFPWSELPSSRQGLLRIRLKVEAFLVTDDLSIGPSTIFEVKG